MILVLSGEGPSDIGACNNALGKCDDGNFIPGPMTVVLDQMLEPKLGYSIRSLPESLYFFTETALCQYAKALPMRLQPARSKKKGIETGYYFVNAMALGRLAKELEQESNDIAIAVLFRDNDGTRSTPCLWEQKWQSMQQGFQNSEFSRGVPMLPKPKSEAWLICAASSEATHCAQFEQLSGNDASPNSAKQKLDAIFGEHKSAAELCEWLSENPLDIDRAANMPSFKKFQDDLIRALEEVLH